MTKQLTRREQQTVRTYVLGCAGAKQARVAVDGAVHVYGAIPNTNENGWYFAGWASDLLAMSKALAPFSPLPGG